MRRVLIAGAIGLMAAGCATAPKDTVASLNRHDPEFRTRDCRQARTAASRYDDQRNGRLVVAVAGNLIVPFAGTAAAATMGAVKEDQKRDLNHRLRSACTSDPLARKAVARR